MKIEHVKGKNKGKIMLYALSTCVWCKKTKKLLDKLGVEYSYLYMDHLGDTGKAMKDLKKWNPKCTFPTIVINDKTSVVGFKEEIIKEVLDI